MRIEFYDKLTNEEVHTLKGSHYVIMCDADVYLLYQSCECGSLCFEECPDIGWRVLE
jgi:hypothetical protein